MLKEMEPAAPLAPVAEDKVKRCWLQMGAEMEGSWKSRKATAGAVRGARVHDDRSVHIAHGDPGEIVTRPHDNMDDLCRDITALWPDAVNDSCGFHVHASFTPLHGSIIATRDFYSYFKEQWHRWGVEQKLDRTHEFWTRLAGRNKFATDKFDPEVQLRGYLGAAQDARRYTMLNFFSWEKHKTIECRMLPMFADMTMAVSAVRHLGWIYDSYLSRTNFSTITMEPSVQVVGNVTEEVYKIDLPDISPKTFEAAVNHPEVVAGPDIFYDIDGANDLMVRAGDKGKITKIVSP